MTMPVLCSSRTQHRLSASSWRASTNIVVLLLVIVLHLNVVTADTSSSSSSGSSSTADSSKPLPPVIELSKFRTWIRDIDSEFRPTAAGATPLQIPKWGRKILPPRLSQFSMVQTPTSELIVFGGLMSSGDNPFEPLAKGNYSNVAYHVNSDEKNTDRGDSMAPGYFQNRTLRFDIEAHQWYEETPWTTVPRARIDHDAWMWGDTMYIYGGANDTVMNDIWSYRNRTWRLKDWENVPRRRGHSASVNPDEPDKVYIFGGSDENREVTGTFFTMDSKGDVKNVTLNTTSSSGPSLRMYHAATVMTTEHDGTVLFIHGGTDGRELFSDLWAFYFINSTWRFLSDGSSPQTYAWDSAVIPALQTPASMLHSCAASFPILFCIGGRPSGDPISMIYDIKLERWVRPYYTNPEVLVPLEGNRVTLYRSKSLKELEIISVGGVTGRPPYFLQKEHGVTMFKTNMFPLACPYLYLNGDWEGRCYLCPAGTGADRRRDPHRCFDCKPGEYSKDGLCLDCPRGTWNNETRKAGVESCIACMEGHFTYEAGSPSIDNCTTCRVGTYGWKGACLPCPAGTRGTVKGTTNREDGCTPCDFGTFSSEGQEQCTECPPGTSSGPFIKSQDPYELVVVTAISGANGVTCSKYIATTVPAEKPITLQLALADVGETPYRYNPLDKYFATGVPESSVPKHIHTDVVVTMEYEGRPGSKLFVNCASVTADPTDECKQFITVNQSTNYPSNGKFSFDGSPCNWFAAYTYKNIRIADYGIYTIRFYAQGSKMASITLNVTQEAGLMVPPLRHNLFLSEREYSNAMEIYAWSLGNIKAWMPEFVGTAAEKLAVKCETGAVSFKLTTNEGFSKSSFVQFLHASPGFVKPNLMFKGSGRQCQFQAVRYSKARENPTPFFFDVQIPTQLQVLVVSNTTNHGLVRVEYRTLDANNNITTADNFTEVRVMLDPAVQASRRHKIFMSKPPYIVKLNKGVAKTQFFVYSTAPWVNLSTWGRAAGVVTSTDGPLLVNTYNNSQKRFYVLPGNGTRLRLVSWIHKMPKFVTANRSFVVEVELSNRRNLQVANRDLLVDVSLLCNGPPGVNRVRLVNVSKHGPSRLKMKAGHAFFHLYVQGPDAASCLLRFREVSEHPSAVRDLYTPSFAVIAPKKLAHDFTCRLVEAGENLTVSVALLSSSGLPVNNSELGILMEVVGNTSAAFDAEGKMEREIDTTGNATFIVQYRPSRVPVTVVFWAAEWILVDIYNYTYQTEPYFKRFEKLIRTDRVLRKIASIRTASICTLTPTLNATWVRILEQRMPKWIESDKPFSVAVEAVDVFGHRDINYDQPVRIRVKNCNHGAHADIMFYYKQGDKFREMYDWSTFFTRMSSYDKFVNGFLNMTLMASFTTDVAFDSGVEGCSIVIGSTSARDRILTPALYEGFSVRHTFPTCIVCPAGFWSPGGNGKQPVGYNGEKLFFQWGGCVPCMVNTFSAETGATSEDSCVACTSYTWGWRWSARVEPLLKYEGSTDCPSTGNCQTGYISGTVGGGPCTSIRQLKGIVSPNSERIAHHGRLARYCSRSCAHDYRICPPGHFRLECSQFKSVALCYRPEHKNNCTWNGTHCLGEWSCQPCPWGTANDESTTRGIEVCKSCHPGGWQQLEGNSAYDDENYYTYSQLYCGKNYVKDFCGGGQRFECPNGTYSPTRGATSNKTCIVCPAGHYCPQFRRYKAQCSNMLSCNPLGQNRGCQNGCKCPFNPASGIIQGATKPIKCPPGTFNNHTGAYDASQCLPCIAGTYCAAGSTTMTVTDVLNTQLLLEGGVMPSGVSFKESAPEDVIDCSKRWESGGSGYVQDGHFDEVAYYYKSQVDDPTLDLTAFKPKWHGSFHYMDENRDSTNKDSFSVRTNSSRGFVAQTMNIYHELPIDMVVRAWVIDSLDRRNLTGLPPIIGNTYIKPFVGFELNLYYVDEDEEEKPGDVETITKFFKPYWDTKDPKEAKAWHLFEMNVYPRRAIRRATLSLSCRGFYQGAMLFDDVSFRPANNRICNCSTGFYYNMSEPSRKCQRCPPGFACSGGTITRCVNSWSTSAMPGCHYCRDGWLCDSDCRGRHIPCEPYTYKSSETQICLPCPVGYACKDGIRHMCHDGKYGDGGRECIVCEPGFYAPKGSPQPQCLRCPPGTTSVGGRSSCFSCPVNTYSPNGTCCYSAPVGSFVPVEGSSTYTSCKNPVMDSYKHVIPRNLHGYVIRVVPYVCEPHYPYVITRVEHVSNKELGKVRISNYSSAVLYDAGPNNYPEDTHVFKVFFTANVHEAEQYATVTVQLTNTRPRGVNDTFWIPHPKKETLFRITTFFSNDYNKENDWLYVYKVTAPLADELSISMLDPPGPPRVPQYDMGETPNDRVGVDYINLHPAVFVNLKAGFRGPMTIRPIVFDQECAEDIITNSLSNSGNELTNCLEMIPQSLITVIARDLPPVAVDDFFRVVSGTVAALDVLANDYDPDGDLINVSWAGGTSIGRTYPQVTPMCNRGDLTECSGCTTGNLHGSCTCGYDRHQDRCRIMTSSSGVKDVETLSHSFVDYYSKTGLCGNETFSYKIVSNDGEDEATVTVENTRCFCDETLSRSSGFRVLFMLDGTMPAANFSDQLAFVASIMERSMPNSVFKYGVMEVGVNKMIADMSQKFFDHRMLSRSPGGDQYPYSLGAALTKAGKLLDNMNNELLWIVVLSASDSYDDVEKPLRSMPMPTKFVTVALHNGEGTFKQFEYGFDKDVEVSLIVKNSEDLVSDEGTAQETIMDRICSLSVRA